MAGTALGIGNAVGAAVSVLVTAVDIVDPVTAKLPASWIVAAPRAPMKTTTKTPTTAKSLTSLAFTMDHAFRPP